ncbi:MAG: multicopper oxidase domain-containing protein [Bdellovibrionales bacterium]|nr:multicopper oxidase domain-containing protein [Bdellovibrionales bacterium]
MRHKTCCAPLLLSGAIGLSLLLVLSSLLAEERELSLTISSREVNFTGETVTALSVNGQLPAPVLRFTEGDVAVVHVTNKLHQNSSIHWHGILLPNRMDGVPNMTFPPIRPGKTFTYRFPLRQTGTYWYHSHSGLQEQRGLYGAIVIDPKVPEAFDEIPDLVVLLSDWTNEDPHEVLHTLKRGSEWYSIQKGSAQSILGAAQLGMLGDYYSRELSRMPPMDISDVAYDTFLINGAPNSKVDSPEGGRLRLRIINGSASTFFYTEFAGGPMKVIAADGQSVDPFEIKRLLLGVAETYDVIVETRKEFSQEFRATSHDNSGSASLWIGEGAQQSAPTLPWPNAYRAMHGVTLQSLVAITPWGAMGMSGDMHSMHHHDHMAMMQKDEVVIPDEERSSLLGLLSEDLSTKENIAPSMSKERPEAPYNRLKAPRDTSFDQSKKVRELRFTLDGDMNRYVWMLNNKVMSEDDSIRINRGEIVRFIMENRTMMYHPMHLHGHFFRVLNKFGAHSPLKHTVIVAPMATTTIEFDAEEEGDWFFHCHLLYHMMSGMARMVHYNDFVPPSDIDQSMIMHNEFFLMGEVSGMSNMAQGHLTLSDARNLFTTEWQIGWSHVDSYEWEAVPLYEYYVNRFWNLFLGANLEGSQNDVDTDQGVAGFRYLLPLNVESRHWLNSDLGYQGAVSKTLELTPRFHLYGEAEYDSAENWELRAGGHYQLSRDFALQAQWHSDYEWGGGIEFQF